MTHGMPCVNMHGTFEDYIRGFTHGQFIDKQGGKKEEKGKREGEREKRKGGKEKNRKEENRRRKRRKRGKKKEEKEGVSCSEQTQMAKNSELRYKR